jgi:hypothetical protein
MSEADLKNALTAKLREQLPGFIVFRHEDHRTSAIPDISITGNHRTSWLEVKYAHPRLEGFELQHLRMRQLAVAGYAWYVIYQDATLWQRTLIVEPSDLDRWSGPRSHWSGYIDHQLVVDFIREVHSHGYGRL